MFDTEDYRYPIAELRLGKPESEEWKLFTSSDEVQVYAFLDQETGYFQWKVGHLKINYQSVLIH